NRGRGCCRSRRFADRRAEGLGRQLIRGLAGIVQHRRPQHDVALTAKQTERRNRLCECAGGTDTGQACEERCSQAASGGGWIGRDRHGLKSTRNGICRASAHGGQPVAARITPRLSALRAAAAAPTAEATRTTNNGGGNL